MFPGRDDLHRASARAQIDDTFREHVDDLAGALQAAANEQEARRHDRAAIAGKDLRPDDDVGDARLVLEREEDDLLPAGHLTDENESGNADFLSVSREGRLVQVGVRRHAIPFEALTEERHRVRLQ